MCLIIPTMRKNSSTYVQYLASQWKRASSQNGTTECSADNAASAPAAVPTLTVRPGLGISHAISEHFSPQTLPASHTARTQVYSGLSPASPHTVSSRLVLQTWSSVHVCVCVVEPLGTDGRVRLRNLEIGHAVR